MTEDESPTAKLPSAPEQARSVERQGLVLSAALDLLLNGGSAAVTHRRVAEESGSSPGAVRYYFRTREDLLVACLDRMESVRHEMAEQVLAQVSPEPSAPPEAVARWILEVYCGPDLEDAAIAGTILSVVDCARESPRLATLLAEQRRCAQRQLGLLLSHCGYSKIPTGLVASVVDGSTLATTLEGGSGVLRFVLAELVGLLELASGA